jgi:hypothetical protein
VSHPMSTVVLSHVRVQCSAAARVPALRNLAVVSWVSVDVLVEPFNGQFRVNAEEVVTLEAFVGALDPVQTLLLDRDGVVDVLHVLRSGHGVVVDLRDQSAQ